jgi:tRNA A-37 threonylcarbamoyl transferase component Bud32/tetratricopeptide (TPR) repeat protein
MGLLEGQNLGPYRIIGQLGQGGMATVFKAYHAKLDRYVAIKIMHQAFQEDPDFLARFEREARIVARLGHPHIVPVYDYAEYEAQPYLVMKFVEGQTLKARLNDGAMKLDEIIQLMTAIADALDYAHRQGVLHRDIKPSNIIIDKDGVPYLTDFGLARIAQAGESTMSQDMLLGTPQYISPEQAMGKKELDSRTDIYSLGVVLYEMIVGRVPFSADTPYAIIHDHIYRPLPLPTLVNPDIPEAIEKVLLKALAKDPADRYETASLMMSGLNAAVKASGITELKADRVSMAAVSLARMREEDALTALRGSAALPIGGAIPSPVASATSATQARPENVKGKYWLTGGLVALGLICFLIFAITTSAMDSLRQLSDLPTLPPNPVVANMTQTEAPATIVPAQTQASATETPSSSATLTASVEATEAATIGSSALPAVESTAEVLDGIMLYAVPRLSVSDAQAAVTANPNDPAAYLALSMAYLIDGNSANAASAFTTGYSLTTEPVRYLLTGAHTADKAGNIGLAAVTYSQAYRQSVITNTYPQTREIVGSYLYEAAQHSAAQIGSPELQRITDAPEGSDYPLLEAMAARIYMGRNNLVAAERWVSRALLADNTLAEAHLVRGDLYQARNAHGRARNEWTAALSSGTDTPQWVLDVLAGLLGVTLTPTG